MREENIDKLLRRFGEKNTPIFLKALAKGKHFAQAIETPIGKELLSDATGRLEALTGKVIQELSNPEERAEIRALKTIIGAWSDIIMKYQKDMQEFQKTTGE